MRKTVSCAALLLLAADSSVHCGGTVGRSVVHHSPRSVQFSCIADGAAAATGASRGKLDLSLVETSEARVEPTYRRRSTGQVLTLPVDDGRGPLFAHAG
ncbi:hypothetical protein WME91_51900 [Sorangium sp. So ce269]